MRKAAGTAVLLAMAVASILLVRSSSGMKSWVEEITGKVSAVSEAQEPNLSDSVDAAAKGRPVSPLEDEDETIFPPFPSDVELPAKTVEVTPEKAVIIPTTIEGGMVIRNSTSFEVDIEGLLRAGPSQALPQDGVQVLIIHTHGSESYTPDAENNYANTDNYHVNDKNLSVIRVGDELAACLEAQGISVIHDREIYDYPSYNGSYNQSGAAVSRYLEEHPEISIVLDLHRDALGSNGVVYKTVAESDRQPSSQIMLLVGTDESGNYHPNWRENMKLALYLQSAAVNKYPSLMRPISIRTGRFNQHLTTGSLLLEIGSTGNTLPEALQAIRLFADAIAPALLELKAQ